MGDEYPVTLLVGELVVQSRELRPIYTKYEHQPDRTKQCAITLLQGTCCPRHVNVCLELLTNGTGLTRRSRAATHSLLA